ncbi:MAG: hypothetical protein ACXWW0_10925, partial [Bacteroidia bacterium]
FFVFLIVSCSDYGKKLQFNNGELYYTSKINEQEALELGNFLAKDNLYFDGRPKSVQLDKKDDTYIFRAVVLKDAEKDTSNISPFIDLGIILSKEVFDNAPVDMEMCDEKFNTLRSIPFKKK